MVEDNFSYLFDVSNFKVKEVKSTKTSKIFEVSFKSEDEDMNGIWVHFHTCGSES